MTFTIIYIIHNNINKKTLSVINLQLFIYFDITFWVLVIQLIKLLIKQL